MSGLETKEKLPVKIVKISNQQSLQTLKRCSSIYGSDAKLIDIALKLYAARFAAMAEKTARDKQLKEKEGE